MKQLVTLCILLVSTMVFAQTADAVFKKGISKYQAKDYKGAITDFSKAAALNPKNTNALYYRAVCKQRLEDYKGAIEDYTKVIKSKPTADAYTNRGLSKYILLNLSGTQEEYKAIVADYTQAIGLNAKDTVAYLNRGITKDFLKDYTGSIDDFSKLCEMNPRNGEAYYYRANSEDKADKKEAACEDWDKALELGETRAQPMKAKNCNQ